MQAKMAAIAGTRPSITTNAIIIETIAAIFFWRACVGVRMGSGSMSSVVFRPKFFRMGLIDTDKFVGGDQKLTAKVTFLSTYPSPGLLAWSVFSWVSVAT